MHSGGRQMLILADDIFVLYRDYAGPLFGER